MSQNGELGEDRALQIVHQCNVIDLLRAVADAFEPAAAGETLVGTGGAHGKSGLEQYNGAAPPGQLRHRGHDFTTAGAAADGGGEEVGHITAQGSGHSAELCLVVVGTQDFVHRLQGDGGIAAAAAKPRAVGNAFGEGDALLGLAAVGFLKLADSLEHQVALIRRHPRGIAQQGSGAGVMEIELVVQVNGGHQDIHIMETVFAHFVLHAQGEIYFCRGEIGGHGVKTG